MNTNGHEFMLETLVDFPDDALGAPEPIGEDHIDAMMRRLAECGVRRVSWSYYADGRGDAYTAFLAQAKRQINARGRRMRINFQIDWYRPDPADSRRLAYPDNLDFQWRRWIEEGMTDEAVLRFYQLPFACVFEDAVAQELVARCRGKGIPVTVNRYINFKPDELADEFRRVREDSRFAGFILYEASRFLDYRPGGDCDISMPVIKMLKEQS